MQAIHLFDFHSDINYMENRNPFNTFHLFSPRNGCEACAAVILVHGGGWRAGSKDSQLALAATIASWGYVTATVGYRLSDEAPFPAAIEDVTSAIRYLVAHAGEYRIDPQRLALLGSSAGGHLVALAGCSQTQNPFKAGPYQNTGYSVRAVIDICGPTDLVVIKDQLPALGETEKLESVLYQFLRGDEETIMDRARQASPVQYVSPESPAFLIFHGGKDPIVPIDQAYALARALKEAAVPVETCYHADAEHGVFGCNYEENLMLCRRFLEQQL